MAPGAEQAAAHAAASRNGQDAGKRMASSGVLAGADPEQVRLMGERVILVDPDDNVCGHASKVAAHLLSTGLPLHRAFSVMLFDSSNRLLLQQRASTKVTFPLYWANACCSHPLYTEKELGLASRGENVATSLVEGTVSSVELDSVLGAKRAAIRKLSHELGIETGSITTSDLHFLNRIHYRAECKDGTWGEHELDYVLFCRVDVPLRPSANEVESVRYVSPEELRELFNESDSGQPGAPRVSPWFRHIVDSFGWRWWKALVASGPDAVYALADAPDGPVHRLGNAQDYDWRFTPTTEHPE